MEASGQPRDLIDGIVDAWRAEMPELDHAEFELVKRAARLGVMLEDELSARLAPWNLTKADFNVLGILRSAGSPYEVRPTDLKARLLLTSGGISNVLNRLEKAGHIERERDDDDGRSSWVRLTDTGVETVNATLGAWAAAQADIFRAVPSKVSRAAADALREVLVALGDCEPPAARVRHRSSAAPSQ
jgi:DNA-binding MarR family transcriptional regulator